MARFDRKNFGEYVPSEGRLFVDTCGIAYYREADDLSEKDKVSLNAELYSDASRFLSRRDGLSLSTSMVLEELAEVGTFFRLREERAARELRSLARNGQGRSNYCASESVRLARQAKDKAKEVYGLLSEGRKTYLQGIQGEPVSPEVEDLVSNFVYVRPGVVGACGKPLSFADQEFVSEALGAGEGTGILSADIPAIMAFSKCVKILGLRDCFVSTPISFGTRYISI